MAPKAPRSIQITGSGWGWRGKRDKEAGPFKAWWETIPLEDLRDCLLGPDEAG